MSKRHATPDHPVRREVETARGKISVQDFGGPADGPLLHFAHANGFNGLTYRSILRPLTDLCRITAWDARGHGFSTLPADPARMRSWGTYRNDLVALIDALEEPVYLAGHSMGGSASLLAAGERPDLVRGLLLTEPVVPPSAMALGMGLARMMGVAHVANPLAQGALKRRRHFPSLEAMVTSYIGRGAFKTWTREMIADYVAGGTRTAEDGGVELSCAPEWEAATFMSLPTNLYLALGRFKGPLFLLHGTIGSTCPAPMAELIRMARPNMDLRRIEGASHFLPMERPDLVGRAVRAMIAGTSLD